MECIFCQIAAKKAKAEIIYEDGETMVFQNIRPLAPIHLLIIPKKHIVSIAHILPEESNLIGQVIITAQKAAQLVGLAERGYKLAVNVGQGGGQEIFHLHFHLLGGWLSNEERDIPGQP